MRPSGQGLLVSKYALSLRVCLVAALRVVEESQEPQEPQHGSTRLVLPLDVHAAYIFSASSVCAVGFQSISWLRAVRSIYYSPRVN